MFLLFLLLPECSVDNAFWPILPFYDFYYLLLFFNWSVANGFRLSRHGGPLAVPGGAPLSGMSIFLTVSLTIPTFRAALRLRIVRNVNKRLGLLDFVTNPRSSVSVPCPKCQYS